MSASNNGWYYKISVSGNTNINGTSAWGVGDWIISNGTTWDKIINSEGVASINGRLGPITLSGNDVPVFGIGNSHSQGTVPDPGAVSGTIRYLREDGMWTNPLSGVYISSGGNINGNVSAINVSASGLYASYLTPSKALYLDSNKRISTSNTTDVELGYLNGVSASIQNQLSAISAFKLNSNTIISAGNGLVGGGFVSATP